MSHLTHLLKRAMRHAKESVTIRWVEPNASAEVDPTTGATTEPGTNRTCTTTAFVHTVNPGRYRYKAMVEIQDGDLMLDFVIPLYLVTDAGDSSSLAVGDVVDLVGLNQATRALPDCGRAPVATEITLNELAELSFYVMGETWEPVGLGTGAPKTIDASIGGKITSYTLFVRRAR